MKHRAVVERLDEQALNDATGAMVASYGVPGTSRVASDAELTDDPAAIVLSHRVAKQPSDARVHVERINHHLEAGEAEATYGALVDFFIAFDEKASGLRRRMLTGCRHLLHADRYEALEQHIAQGLDRSTPFEPALWSVLSAGVTGHPVVVAVAAVDGDPRDGRGGDGRAGTAGRAGSDGRAGAGGDDRHAQQLAAVAAQHAATNAILARTRDRLRADGVAAAVDVLESAVVEDPANTSLRHSLRDLYHVLDDPARLPALLARLGPAADDPFWAQLAEELPS